MSNVSDYSLSTEVIHQIREMHRPSVLGTLVFMLYACMMYFGVAYLIYLVASSSLFFLMKIIMLVPLYILCAGGLRLMGNLGHDGTHFSLHHNKVVSTLIGCFFSSSVIGFTEMGFAVSHWYHHRYTNQLLDPDVIHYSKFPKSEGFLKRLFLAFPSRIPHYYLNTIKMAIGKPLSYDCKLAFNAQTIKILSFLNIVFSIFWLSVYITITIYNPLLGVASIWLPNIIALLGNSFTVFIQHAGTTQERLYNSRSLISPMTTVLYFGGNYHLEHHLYPGIPMYRLPALHCLLKEQGVYNQQEKVHLDSVPFAELAHAWSNYPDGSVA